MTAADQLRVLIVEDEAVVALDLEDIVTELGHAVVGCAATAEQALALLDDLDTPPDTAIVDANLAGQSARPVVEKLRDLGVAVVVASGYAADELEHLGFVSPSINKPYSAGDVETALLRTR